MYIGTTTSLGCLYQTFHVLVNRAEEVRSAPNTCILPKETQSQPRSRSRRRPTGRSDTRGGERGDKRASFGRRKRGKYILHSQEVNIHFPWHARAETAGPSLPFSLFLRGGGGGGVPPVCGKGRPLRNRRLGKGCVWYGWDMVHVLCWGTRTSTVAGLAAIVPVNHPPAWRVLWLQWKRDFYVWAMVGDGGCSGPIDGVLDGICAS